MFSDEDHRSTDGKRWRVPLEIIASGLFEVLTAIILEFLGKESKIKGQIYYYRYFFASKLWRCNNRELTGSIISLSFTVIIMKINIFSSSSKVP